MRSCASTFEKTQIVHLYGLKALIHPAKVQFLRIQELLMKASSDGNPLQLEVILMFEPHRLEHHLLQSAYAILVPLHAKRLPTDTLSSASIELIQQDLRKEEGAK